MSQAQYILFAGNGAWRVAVYENAATHWHDLQDDAADSITAVSTSRAKQLGALLRDLHYAGQPILVALSTDRCMATTLSIDGLPRNDFKARLYRLETQLPVDAEQIIADFCAVVPAGSNECMLAVCSDRTWLEELVAALEASQIVVGPIVPAALLAAQARISSEAADGVMLLGEPAAPNLLPETLNLVNFSQGRPIRWVMLSPALAEVRLQLEWQALQSRSIDQVELLGINGELADQISAFNGWKLKSIDGDPADFAAAAGADVLLARHKPLIDLRRGPLAIADRWRHQRKALNAVLTAAAALLLSVCLSLVWRAARYSTAAAQNESKMHALFHQTLPDWSIPANIKAVIESEHRKHESEPSTTRAGSALATLHAVLTRIAAAPDVAPSVSIQRLNFTPQRFELSGQLKSYEAADSLASALSGGGLTIAPPQARRTGDGNWSFTVQGVAGSQP